MPAGAILLVDDHPINLEVMRAYLGAAGYPAILTAASAEQGLAVLAAEPGVAVVVSDIEMPGRNGLFLAREAKRTAPAVQVILISGYPVMGYPIDALRLGAVDYLPKPIDRDALVGAVDRAFASWRQATQAVADAGQVFISYGREDAEAVRALRDRLLRAGYRPWLDVCDLVAGERWLAGIQAAIRASGCFLACLSTRSVNKRGVLQQEIRTALDEQQRLLDTDIFVLPLRLDDCVLPDALKVYQRTDYFADDGWDRLVAGIAEGARRRSAG